MSSATEMSGPSTASSKAARTSRTPLVAHALSAAGSRRGAEAGSADFPAGPPSARSLVATSSVVWALAAMNTASVDGAGEA